MARKKITAPALRALKQTGTPITMLTCYDAAFARLLDAAGIDCLLVGDSLGMVIQGGQSTLAVRMEHMIYHCAAVARGRQNAFLIGDMPFLSYRTPEIALENAGRLIQDGSCEAVKLEGGSEMAPTVRRITEAGIPVVGHLGLTPQSVNMFGGYKLQGRETARAQAVRDGAKALEEAGACAIVLELIPGPLANEITTALTIPTIGIGAGSGCDGQVLVIYDLLGMDPNFKPKFLKQYARLGDSIHDAVTQYIADVQSRRFPEPAHTYG